MIGRIAFLAGLLCALIWNDARAVTNIVSDSSNVAGSGSGFALDTGINSGINPPTTRLTGTAKTNLRYIPTDTGKASTNYTINANRIQVAAAPGRGRFVLSADGVNSFDFGDALGIGTASPANPVVYDLSIRINNNSRTTERFAFALGTAEGDVNTWAFAVQVYRTNSANSFYTVGKRIDTSSSGLANDLNEHITSLTGQTYGGDLTILMRVTDAGAESTTLNSRVQLSLNGGNSWFYDTKTDPSLTGPGTGFHFNGPQRHIMWDIAPDAGPITFDAFSLKRDPPASNVNTTSIFRVIQYNIHFGVFNGLVNTQDTANFILNQHADLVSMNEVDRFRDRSNNRDLVSEYADETGMFYAFTNANTALSGIHESGDMVLSKYPIIERERILLPNVADNEQRALLKTVVDVNGKFLCFWATHLDFHPDDAERLMCVTNFNQWVTNETLPIILCGDFNDTPGGAAPLLMEQKWNDSWDTAGDGTAGQTVPCPGPPGKRIDYIWKAKGARVTSTNAYVGSLINSDHFSVVSQFIFENFTDHATGFYFPFNQGAGTKVTDTISGLTGALGSAAPTWNTNTPTGQPGDFSLFFDGTKTLTIIDTNQIIGTNGLNDDYTLQAWVKLPLNYAPAQRAILFQYERKPGFAISINTNRTLHTSVFNVRDIPSTATIPNDSQWHHVAVVHTDSANIKFYIDGQMKAQATYTSGAGYRTDTRITMGSAAHGSNPFTGYLDRVRFDQIALSPAQFDFPATPMLGVRQNGATLTVFWPAPMTDYQLQSNGNLQPTGWTNIPFQQQGPVNQTTITPTTASQFFRLKR